MQTRVAHLENVFFSGTYLHSDHSGLATTRSAVIVYVALTLTKCCRCVGGTRATFDVTKPTFDS